MASAKKAAKKASKKAPAKKAAPKKAPTKKPASKKPPAKKVTSKRAASKKVAPKKVAPKKVAPKKVAPKKVAPKKVAPKKPPAKRVTAKSPASKKQAPKKATGGTKPSAAANALGHAGEGARFRDWGFRLLVIDTLHGLGHFHEELERARELAADAEENTISGPAREVLDAIVLTPALLGEVTHLSLGVGGVHHALTSEWDGEDDIFEVKRVDDVDLLPNLVDVTVISNIAEGTDLSPIGTAPKLESFRCTIGDHWAKGLAAFEPLRQRGVTVTLSS